MSIAFETEADSRRREEFIAIADFAGEMMQQFRSPDLVFRMNAQSVSSVTNMLIKSGLLSGEASRRQLKKAIERVESAMLLAFDISLSPDRIWQLNVAKAALDAAELLKPQEDRVKNAETIILSLFYNSVSEAPLLFPDAPQNSMPRLSAQSSAQFSKPFKTIAIILAIIACLVGICAAISSKDREADAPATTESTTQARAVRQAESTTNSTTIATTKHSANSVDIDYDETVYVETASKRFHRASCSVKDNSKEMIVKMTRREAVKNKNNPCSACFHD
ncbi:MAG: hypothetical protein EGQ82_04770 [Clostridiales bacterium]|nr:hypothetical protein [Clostridiales bacterium]MBD8959762.1 hypothetical protein [Clostridiales bacterium]